MGMLDVSFILSLSLSLSSLKKGNEEKKKEREIVGAVQPH
jgi:hypothetical protein